MKFSSSLPLVSVPLCTYNGERFLPAQLESLLAQSHANLEILAFDDGSIDGTVDILRDYSARDRRLRVHANPRNMGFRNNFVQAIGACTGEFIAPCDQDDIWLPSKIEILVEHLGDCALAYCNSRFIDADGVMLAERVSDCVGMVEGDDPLPFAFANCTSGHAMLFRSKLRERLSDIPGGFFHDWWIAALATVSGGVVYCNRELVLYRQHGANVTNMLSQAYVPRSHRPAGYRLRELREIGERLHVLATLDSRHQSFLRRFSDLWCRRESEWVSWQLGCIMLRQGARLRRIEKQPINKIVKDALQMFPGIKLKRLISPKAYASEAVASDQGCYQ